MRFKNPMNREALALLSKDELIDLVLSLAARLDELERRLGLNSTNSGKPPSSDGLSKPPAGKQKRRRTGSLREKSGRKPGGQKGHEGETLRQVAEPDAITDHYPETCPNCGSGLTPEMSTGHGARQVFDLPRPLVVMEHRAHRCRCGRCGRQTRAAFPAGVTGPVRYGARIGAMVVYLSHYQLLPEDRLAELMADLFAVALVPATVARMGRSRARRWTSRRSRPAAVVRTNPDVMSRCRGSGRPDPGAQRHPKGIAAHDLRRSRDSRSGRRRPGSAAPDSLQPRRQRHQVHRHDRRAPGYGGDSGRVRVARTMGPLRSRPPPPPTLLLMPPVPRRRWTTACFATRLTIRRPFAGCSRVSWASPRATSGISSPRSSATPPPSWPVPRTV